MSGKKDIKPAKACYEHIGGKLGELLMNAFIKKYWIAKETSTGKHFYITDLGKKEFAKLGVDVSVIKSENIL